MKDSCNIKNCVKAVLPNDFWPFIRRKIILFNHRRVAKKMKIIVDKCLNGELNDSDIFFRKKIDIPEGTKIIWQYWAQGYAPNNQPELIKLCLKSVEEHASDFLIIRLSDENISQYIDFPDFLIKKKTKMSIAHFSDILRCILLSVYGGLWLDATTFLTGKLPNYLFENDFFIYQRDSNAEYKDYWEKSFSYYWGWYRGFRVNCLSGIMFANSGNRIVTDLRNMILFYWKNNNYILDYFQFQILMDVYKENNKEWDFQIVSDVIPHLLRQIINSDSAPWSIEDVLQLTTIHSLNYKNIDAANKLKKIMENNII